MAVELTTAPAQDVMNFEEWSAEEVADYFEREGYPEYRSVFIDNELTGARVVLVTQEDVPDMGIELIGHRIGILKSLRALKTKARLQMRKVEIARLEEAYPGCWLGEKFFTCCGICPRDPDQYILKAGKMQIKEYEITRICGSFKCVCLGGEWHNDNITLDRIKDVDTVVSTSGFCCCRISKTKILLAVSAGADAEDETSRVVQKELFVEGDVGTAFADQIMQQAEEYIMQQRGVM